MTAAFERYPFVERHPSLGMASLAPVLPITLLGATSLSAFGLLDTGATVNVLPYSAGEQLGAVWEQQTTAERTRTGSKGHAPQLPCPSRACRRAWAPG